MATEQVLDIDSLLEPIAGDLPAGDPRAYLFTIRAALEELRQEDRPEDFDEATRPAVLRRADWPGVVRLSSEALRETTKDVRIACHLLEGLVKVHGFAGLRDGLVVLRRLIDECWDRLVPEIDDGDLESRAAPIANLLDDAERGMRFPTSIRRVPLFVCGSDSYGLLDWNKLRGKSDDESQKTLQKVLSATSYEVLQTRVDDASASLDELRQLVQVMDQRMGAEAPALLQLGAAINECLVVLKPELAAIAPAEMTTSVQSNGQVARSGEPLNQAVLAREIYGQLSQAAEMLRQLEPHSPIPYLIQRAVELGRLPFPRLVKQLIRDGNVLDELNREMGIKESSDEELPSGV